jgi:hypothetical protein
MRLKKNKAAKVLLLKIFIAQQKNKLRLKLKLKPSNLRLLFLLWNLGYIIGFTRVALNYYTIFLKKQFKQFSIRFLENNLTSKMLSFYNYGSSIETQILISFRGLKASSLDYYTATGFLLCALF